MSISDEIKEIKKEFSLLHKENENLKFFHYKILLFSVLFITVYPIIFYFNSILLKSDGTPVNLISNKIFDVVSSFGLILMNFLMFTILIVYLKSKQRILKQKQEQDIKIDEILMIKEDKLNNLFLEIQSKKVIIIYFFTFIFSLFIFYQVDLMFFYKNLLLVICYLQMFLCYLQYRKVKKYSK